MIELNDVEVVDSEWTIRIIDASIYLLYVETGFKVTFPSYPNKYYVSLRYCILFYKPNKKL